MFGSAARNYHILIVRQADSDVFGITPRLHLEMIFVALHDHGHHGGAVLSFYAARGHAEAVLRGVAARVERVHLILRLQREHTPGDDAGNLQAGMSFREIVSLVRNDIRVCGDCATFFRRLIQTRTARRMQMSVSRIKGFRILVDQGETLGSRLRIILEAFNLDISEGKHFLSSLNKQRSLFKVHLEIVSR